MTIPLFSHNQKVGVTPSVLLFAFTITLLAPPITAQARKPGPACANFRKMDWVLDERPVQMTHYADCINEVTLNNYAQAQMLIRSLKELSAEESLRPWVLRSALDAEFMKACSRFEYNSRRKRGELELPLEKMIVIFERVACLTELSTPERSLELAKLNTYLNNLEASGALTLDKSQKKTLDGLVFGPQGDYLDAAIRHSFGYTNQKVIDDLSDSAPDKTPPQSSVPKITEERQSTTTPSSPAPSQSDKPSAFDRLTSGIGNILTIALAGLVLLLAWSVLKKPLTSLWNQNKS